MTVLGASEYQAQTQKAREPRNWIEVQGNCPFKILSTLSASTRDRYDSEEAVFVLGSA